MASRHLPNITPKAPGNKAFVDAFTRFLQEANEVRAAGERFLKEDLVACLQKTMQSKRGCYIRVQQAGNVPTFVYVAIF